MKREDIQKLMPAAVLRRAAEGLRSSLRRAGQEIDDPADRERLRRILGPLLLIRVVVLSIILSLSSWELLTSGNGSITFTAAFLPIAIMFGLSALNAAALRYVDRYLHVLGYVQLLTDVFLSGLVLFVSGSMASSFLFLLVILEAAFVYRKHGAVIIAAVSALLYSVVQSGIFLRPDGTAPSASGQDIVLVYLSFIVIALISAYLAEYLQKLGNLAESHAKDLTALTNQQKQLFDDISEGIITLDLDSVVTSMNQAARNILGLLSTPDSRIHHRKITTVLADLGFENARELFAHSTPFDTPQDLVLKRSGSEENIHLNYIVRPLIDSAQNETGRLVIFNDISRIRSIEQRLHLHETMAKLLASTDQTPGVAKQFLNIHMVGESQIMKHVLTLIERVAQSDASVLITGESGTGKELIARAIHSHAARRNKPFVAINCGAIPENLIESELFGHKKGSFTGAVADNPGLFRQANNGTIFLDEIGELPLHLQSKLLRVLQEKRVRSVGDVHDNPVDVRVLAATNKDLKKEIARGTFREDLYYRLNVVNIIVPPLRNRKEDIPLLVRYFIGRACDPDAVLPSISPEALQMLSNYSFPGNIRELENIIERALVLGGQAILPEHLPEEVRKGSPALVSATPHVHSATLPETKIIVLPVDLENELARIEKELLLKALQQSGGVKKQAAELLGLNFRSLRYRLKKYGLGEESGEKEEDEKASDDAMR